MNTEKAEGGGVPPRLPAAGAGVGWPAGRLGKAVGVFIFFTRRFGGLCLDRGGPRSGAGRRLHGRFGKVRSDYVLMLLESCLGLLILFLPSMLEKRFRIILPSRMYLLFVVSSTPPSSWGKSATFTTGSRTGTSSSTRSAGSCSERSGFQSSAFSIKAKK